MAANDVPNAMAIVGASPAMLRPDASIVDNFPPPNGGLIEVVELPELGIVSDIAPLMSCCPDTSAALFDRPLPHLHCDVISCVFLVNGTVVLVLEVVKQTDRALLKMASEAENSRRLLIPSELIPMNAIFPITIYWGLH